MKIAEFANNVDPDETAHTEFANNVDPNLCCLPSKHEIAWTKQFVLNFADLFSCVLCFVLKGLKGLICNTEICPF